jgi:hypothetical protein
MAPCTRQARDRATVLSCHAGPVPPPHARQARGGSVARAPVLALVILVFVDAHDAATPLPGALARAAEEALGSDASVSIRNLANNLPPAALVDAGRAEHATAVARVTWTDERRLEARLDVVAVGGGPARNSTITFDASDPLAERGRAIGLVLAALLAPEKQAHLEREKDARAVAAAAEVARTPPPAPPARRLALDAGAEGGFAIGGGGTGAGGAIGLRWQHGSRFGLRIGVRGRFGEVRNAEATVTDLAAAAGLIAFMVPPADERRFALALRADVLLLYELLSHLSPDDVEAVRRGHLLPGASVLVEGQLAISPTVAVLLAAGPEVAFGRTDVFVHQEKVADVAPFRLVVEGGLVARF